MNFEIGSRLAGKILSKQQQLETLTGMLANESF
jgi:hypothetical protein